MEILKKRGKYRQFIEINVFKNIRTYVIENIEK